MPKKRKRKTREQKVTQSKETGFYCKTRRENIDQSVCFTESTRNPEGCVGCPRFKT